MGVRVSEKYGVNPSVDTCFICGKETNVVLFGTSYKDENDKTAKAPRQICTGEICEDCQKIIKDGGIFFIAVKDGETGKNPYRTGKLIAVKEEAVQKMFPDFKYNNINYIEESVFNKVFQNV